MIKWAINFSLAAILSLSGCSMIFPSEFKISNAGLVNSSDINTDDLLKRLPSHSTLMIFEARDNLYLFKRFDKYLYIQISTNDPDIYDSAEKMNIILSLGLFRCSNQKEIIYGRYAGLIPEGNKKYGIYYVLDDLKKIDQDEHLFRDDDACVALEGASVGWGTRSKFIKIPSNLVK